MSHEKQLIESILFSTSKPVTVKDIEEATGLKPRDIRRILKQLMEEYSRDEDKVMEIVKAGKKYVMQLKQEYIIPSVMKPEINEEILKTLSLIALHQPVKQSNLRRMLGPKIYEHVDKLVEMKLVHSKKHGSTELLTLTPRFSEYFGIESTKPDEIKKFLLEKITDIYREGGSKV